MLKDYVVGFMIWGIVGQMNRANHICIPSCKFMCPSTSICKDLPNYKIFVMDMQRLISFKIPSTVMWGKPAHLSFMLI